MRAHRDTALEVHEQGLLEAWWAVAPRLLETLVTSATSETLRRAQIQRFWTLGPLSQPSGISAITIARLEAGKHTPTVRTVLALAKPLGVHPGPLGPWKAVQPHLE